ncbi:hypothetical protein ABTK97_19115 [Acinetobacter baumannii]
MRAGPFPSGDEARAMADKLRTENGLESSLVEKR